MSKVYIYALLDENGDPFYVGKTVSLVRRLSKHLSKTRNGERYPVNNKIRKLLREGHEIRISIIEETDEDHADECERSHIKQLREEGRKLYNLADGGEGGKGINPEIMAKILETKQKNGTLKPSQETKAKPQ